MLSTAVLFAAEKSPLLGLTREQLLDKLGEPKSNIAAGGREVVFFAKERVVLRNGIVVEVDLLPPDFGARRATSAPAPAPAPTAAPTASAPAAPTPVPGDPTVNPGGGAVPQPAAAPAAAAPASAPTTTAETPSPAPAALPEPQLAIKSVRPPSAGATRPAPKTETAAKTPVPKASNSTKAAETKAESAAPVAAKSPTSTAPTAPKAAPAPAEKTPEPAPSAEPAVASTDTPAPATEPAAADRPDNPDAAPAPEPKKAAPKKEVKRQLAESDLPEPEEAIFTGRTYLFTALIVGAGVGFLVWQRRQRQLELAASAVSRPPFSVAPSTTEGAMFPSDLLGSLEWKRFEELVAAYYSKTGVVAVRTKAGPDSPVHIKISWKGESRPFALVQCLAYPVGLVDAPRIQELFGVLTTEDIRRGYVVTTGKFNVAARDYAEEKHITLLSGDLLLEKLNALPAPVRTELIQEFSVGDYTTPSCPKCDAKMVPSEADPKVWVCKTHPDSTVRAWK
jgi:hypothetical protein